MKTLNRKPFLLLVAGKAFTPPPGGWDSVTFRARGAELIAVMFRTSQIVIRRQGMALAAKLKKRMVEQGREIAAAGLSRLDHHGGRAAKVLDILLGGEAYWAGIINEILGQQAPDLQAYVKASVQSTMAQAVSKVGMLLGEDGMEDLDMARRIGLYAEGIAQRITRIDETTRNRLETTVRNSIANGDTVTDTARKIRENAEGMSGPRSILIARTESNNAWTQGSAAMFQASASVTHVSVIGCQAREPGSPQYRGESTCNIQDVPVEDADKLEFHINHTGTMVPSRFRDPLGRGTTSGLF